MTIELTPASTELFKELAEDAPNWSGVPLYGGNVASSVSRNGSLTDLKKKGLIVTDEDEDLRHGGVWVCFTDEGHAFASSEFGIEIDDSDHFPSGKRPAAHSSGDVDVVDALTAVGLNVFVIDENFKFEK